MPQDIITPDGTSATIEWLSVKAAVQKSSLSRSLIYELIDAGEIKSASIRKQGNLRGRRLISAESLREFIESQATGGTTNQKN